MKRIQYKLDNGMNVILQPTATAPVVACNVWVGVGSADEEPHEAGLAHVHEHMLFKGTENRGVGEIARDVESAGGHINAFTSFDQTCYYVVISSRYFDNGLDILADAIQRSSFDADELERELEVIQEEIKRGEDSPSRVASRRLFEAAFKTHPYRLPVIGTSESVASFDRDDVVAFYEKHYVPKNMTVVLAGDFEVEDAKERVEKYFGDFKGPDYQTRTRPEEPPQETTRAWAEQREIRQNHLRIAFHIPHVLHEDIPALDLLSIILGYGDASHLDRTIQREDQLVTSVFASAYTPREAGLFVVGADFQRDEERPLTAPTGVLRRILEEVFRFRHVHPGAGDLDRARTLLESQAIYSKQTIEGLAMKLGHYQMVAGDPDFEETYYAALGKVSPDDIRRVARRYLTTENTSVSLLSPESDEAVAEEALIAAVEQAFETAKAEAVPSAALSTDDLGFARIEMPDGPTLIVQEDPSVETFSIRALTHGGLRMENEETAGVHKLLSRLVTSGTTSRSALEIAGEVESMAASISGIAGRNSFGLALTGLTRFFDHCFDIFADCILTSTIPDEEFERERRIQKESLMARRDNLAAVTYDQFSRAFFAPHPYGLPVLGTEQTLKAMTPQGARNILRQRQNPQDMVISIVGDVSVEQVVNHVERYFVKSEAPEKTERKFPAFQPPQKPTLVTADLEKEQAYIIAGFPAPTIADDDIYTMDVLHALLSGQGGRLFYELRDRQSLAYSIFANLVVGLDASAFTIRIGTSPEKISQALDGIRRELDKMQKEVLTQEDLERAHRYLIGNHDIGLQRNSSRAMSFGLDELYDLGYRRSLAYGDAISEVTVDDVKALLDKYIDQDRMLVSIVKPPSLDLDASKLGLTLLES